MKKEEINSILIVSDFLTLCEVNSKVYHLTRSYLTNKIKILLNKRIKSVVQQAQ